ncbi:MAG: hypothetical protein P1U50_01180 [Parvibaculaceae bacterium]|nr:hypothetical protein [Parvibaculaceae bacterium]
MKYALVNEASGVVINILVWDGESSYAVAPGHILVPVAENAMIGGTYLAGAFTAKEEG